MKKVKVRTGEIHDLLGKLPDKDLFNEISVGLEKIAFNANSLYKDSLLLKEHDRIRGQNIFFLLSEEEAGKFLLLLDAVRCSKGKPLTKHLKGFNNHIAKGVYAVSSYWKVGDFAEVKHAVSEYYAKRSIDMEKDDWVWVAKNPITILREFSYYVDYIVAYTGEKMWLIPSEDLSISTGLGLEMPEALDLVNSLITLGFTKPASLEVIANIWRPLEMTDQTRYKPDLYSWIDQTFFTLQEKALLENSENSRLVRRVFSGWSFPMRSIDFYPF